MRSCDPTNASFAQELLQEKLVCIDTRMKSTRSYYLLHVMCAENCLRRVEI